MLRSVMPLGAALALVVALAAGALAQDGLEPPERTIESRVLDAGAEPLVDLTYDWVEGQSERATLEMWTAHSSWFNELAMEEHPPFPFRLEITTTVESVDADGQALVESRIDDVALLEPGTDADADALLSDLETLSGVVVRQLYDDKGYIVRELVLDPHQDTDDLHPARAVALSTAEGMVLRLPLEPIGIGGTWEEVVTSTDVPAGIETLTKRLTDVTTDGGYRVEATTVVDMPRQEAPGDGFGLDEPVNVHGQGGATQVGHAQLDHVQTAWAGTYDVQLKVEVPLGTLVTITMDTTAGARAVPARWEDASWPTLPPIDESLLPEDPSPGETGALASDPAQIGVVVLDPGAEPREELRYRLSEGQVEHSVMVMRMGVRSKLDGAWTDWLGMPPTEVASTTTVTAVREDGTYDVETVFTDVSVPAESQLPADALAEYEAELAGMIGLRQLLHMDDRGRILGAETVVPPGTSSGALQPTQLDAMVQDFLDPLPEEAVGSGAQWEVERVTSDTMGFAVTGGNRLSLVELLPDGRLVLEGTIEMSAEPGPFVIPEMAYVDATIDRFTMDGGVSKTVDLGLVNPEGASDAISDYAFSIRFGDATETTEMQMSVEFESRLVGVEGTGE